MAKVVLLVPEAPAPEVEAVKDAPRRQLKEFRLGLLDNSKSNADHLLRMIMDGAQAGLPVSAALTQRKSNVSLPAPKEILDKLAAECDFVVTAMGD